MDEPTGARSTFYEEVGERIRASRKDKHLRQQQIAAMLGVSDAGYAQWEAGQRRIPVDQLLRISELLAVNAMWLLTGDADEAHPTFHTYRRLPAIGQEMADEFVALLARQAALGKSEGFGLSPAVSQNSLVPSRRRLALA